MKKKGNSEQSIKIWGKLEDSKLRALFETPLSKGGINPEDTTKSTLGKIIQKHFTGKTTIRFASCFVKKR